jgi:hypothetical protein
MPFTCYGYPADGPARIPGRGQAQAVRRDLRRMPYPCYSYPMMCFSYPDDEPRGGGDSGAAQPPSPGLRMPSTCFRY